MKPLTPDFITPATAMEQLVTAIVKSHCDREQKIRLVELGWISPDGRPLDWKYWHERRSPFPDQQPKRPVPFHSRGFRRLEEL